MKRKNKVIIKPERVKMPNTSVRFVEGTLVELSRVAEETGYGPSELIRLAVEYCLESESFKRWLREMK